LRKDSLTEEGISVFSTASAFAGWRSRRALAEAKCDAVLQASSSFRIGDPDARDATRRVRARSSKERTFHLSRAVLIRNLLLHASGFRRAQVVVSRLRLTGSRCGNASRANATGIRWCRRVAERKLHSWVRIETLAGCARALLLGCRSRQATPRFREACSHRQTRRVDGNLAFDAPQGSLFAKEAVRGRLRRPSREPEEVRSRAFERVLRGKGP